MLFKVTLLVALSCAALAVPTHYGASAGGQDAGDSASFGDVTGHGASAGGDQGIFKGFAYSHVNVYRPKTQSIPIYYNYYESAPQHHGATSQGGEGGLDAFKTHSALQGFGQKVHSGFSAVSQGGSFGGAEAHDGASEAGEYIKQVGAIQAAEGSFGGSQSGHGQFPEFQEFQAKAGGAGGYSGQVASGNDQYHGQSAEHQEGANYGLFYPSVTHNQQLHY